MAASESVVDRFNSFVTWADGVSDPRTKEWFLIASPYSTYSLVLLYLLIVWQGRRFMATREALQLKGVMMVYNFIMVLMNVYLFTEFVAVTFLNPNFSSFCQGVDYSDDIKAVRLAAVCWWFFFSKIVEFADTFIFILRKKNNQVSFLHVYHHATMPMLWWFGVRWVAGGASYLSGTVNSFIHILMYSYYFLSALGPWIQPYLWWKRYLTSLQLIQFFLIMFHAIGGLLVDCSFPKPYVYALIAYLTSHIILFSNFYRQSYRKPKKADKGHENGGAISQEQQQNGSGRYYLRERQASRLKDE